MTPKIGKLYGVGVGPGDPELITMKAHRILSTVPVVFVPLKDSGSESLALSIIDSHIDNSRQEIVRVVMPMLSDSDELASYWEAAADSVWQHLSKGDDCAFVNVGDPLLYGTFVHLLRTMRRKHSEVEVEVVPGICSPTAAAARALVPLASEDDRIAIIGPDHDDDFVRLTLRNFDTVVFIKIRGKFARLLDLLDEMDLVDKSVYVRRCTTDQERIITDIRTLRGEKLDYFSLLLVRK
jgi:precorrin-2/cobalt-factor-2 C20-methyltransferase